MANKRLTVELGRHSGGTKLYVLMRGDIGLDYGFAIWGGIGKVATVVNYGRNRFNGLKAEKEARSYSFKTMEMPLGDNWSLPEIIQSLGFKKNGDKFGVNPMYPGSEQKLLTNITAILARQDGMTPKFEPAFVAEDLRHQRQAALATKSEPKKEIQNWGLF